jgi:hypothetical protein
VILQKGEVVAATMDHVMQGRNDDEHLAIASHGFPLPFPLPPPCDSEIRSVTPTFSRRGDESKGWNHGTSLENYDASHAFPIDQVPRTHEDSIHFGGYCRSLLFRLDL